MKTAITFLGTGTSHGLPKINCECPVCSSESAFDKRLRCSILIERGESVVLVDTSADFRAQALKFKIRRIDAILFTHEHADHLHGIDDIRAYQTKTSRPMECFGPPSFCSGVKNRFSYIFLDEVPAGGGIPRISLTPVTAGFEAAGIGFTPVPVEHGHTQTYGYRFSGVAYIPDAKRVPEESMQKLAGLDVLIIDALRRRPHATHMCFDETVELVRALAPKKTYFTHIDHEISHEAESAALEKLGLNISIAYDGLAVEV